MCLNIVGNMSNWQGLPLGPSSSLHSFSRTWKHFGHDAVVKLGRLTLLKLTFSQFFQFPNIPNEFQANICFSTFLQLSQCFLRLSKCFQNYVKASPLAPASLLTVAGWYADWLALHSILIGLMACWLIGVLLSDFSSARFIC